MQEVDIQYLRNSKALYGEGGLMPATNLSAGMDLRACMEEKYIDIPAGERYGFGSGIALAISAVRRMSGIDGNAHENGTSTNVCIAGFVYSRSGLGAVKGLCVAQGVGVIDSDYRGEIVVYLLNTSGKTLRVEQGDRIAQLIFQNYFPVSLNEVDILPDTERGTGGFGHSGVK